MEGQIKVTPQELISASSDFQGRNSTINDITGQMLTLAKNLANQWEGEGATSYISKFNELEDDMQMINKKISEHVKDLQEMAQAYEKAENEVANLSSGVNVSPLS